MASAMGATFRGAQKLLGTIKIFIYSFLNLYFGPHTTINCEATQRTHIERITVSRVCCVSSTKHYDKTTVL